MNYSNKPLKVRHLYHILKFCVKGIDGLKDYIKSINYIPINYTSKIKDINDYFMMVFKAIDEKYIKCVFYILLKK